MSYMIIILVNYTNTLKNTIILQYIHISLFIIDIEIIFSWMDIE